MSDRNDHAPAARERSMWRRGPTARGRWQLPLVGLAMLAVIAASLTFGGLSPLSPNPVGAQGESSCVSNGLLTNVRHYYDINKHRAPGYGHNWKRVLIAFGDVEDANLTAMTAADASERETRWWGWKSVREALECIEEAAEQQPPPPPPPPTPEISIAAGSAVTEGTDASFAITATPAPSSALTVDVTVSQHGDFASTASRTVTIQNSGSATLAVPTMNDSADEPDGSVTATLSGGSGYTVSTSANAATVAVSDDDVPELSIASDGDVTEGSAASFTVTADPTPHASLGVNVSVSATGDFGVTSAAQTVTIPTSGSKSFTVNTSGDSTDEPDGSVTATLSSGSGYTVSTSANAATVAVSDDDDPPPTPEISIAGSADVSEGGNATFTLTSTPAPTTDVDVSVTITQSGDYTSQAGSMTVTISDTGTASFVIGTEDDTRYEDDGSVTATIDAGTGYDVSSTSGAATVAVSDDDDWMTAPQRQQIADCVSFDILNLAIHYYDLNKGNWPDYGKNWRRVLITFGRLQDPELEPMTGDGAREGEAIWSGWKPIRKAIECIEAADPPPPPVAIPEVSITKGSDITEGGKATFTLTATPKQSAEFYVSLTVTQSGTFSSATGTRNVTIDELGTAVLEIATDDDSSDEPDGNIAVTLNTGVAYTLASTMTASVNVADNDAPPAPRTTGTPTIDIADAAAVEGRTMSFTVSVSPTHASDITVDYQTVNGTAISHPDVDDYTHVSGTLTIPAGQNSATIAVQTTADNNNEIEDQFTVEISTTTSGVVVGDGTATGTINNDDAGNVGDLQYYNGPPNAFFSLWTSNVIFAYDFMGDRRWVFRPKRQPPITITVRPYLKNQAYARVVTLEEQYLVFNTKNWNAHQVVHVQIGADFDSKHDRVDIGYDFVEFEGEFTSHDSSLLIKDYAWGEIVQQKPGSTPLVEGDGDSSALYRLKLKHAPLKPVVVTFTNPDPGAVQLSTTSLTFTPENYDQFQEVTITPVADDDGDDEQVEVTVNIPVPGPKGDKAETFKVGVTDPDP